MISEQPVPWWKLCACHPILQARSVSHFMAPRKVNICSSSSSSFPPFVCLLANTRAEKRNAKRACQQVCWFSWITVDKSVLAADRVLNAQISWKWFRGYRKPKCVQKFIIWKSIDKPTCFGSADLSNKQISLWLGIDDCNQNWTSVVDPITKIENRMLET